MLRSSIWFAFVTAFSVVSCAEDLVQTNPSIHDPPSFMGEEDAGTTTSLDAGSTPRDAGSDTGAIPDAGGTQDAGDASTRVGCTKVAHVGDSLTAYTVGPLTDAYSAVSIKAQIDAYGGRAILQRLDADPKTGKQAALDLVANGYKGCWVVALGTNDTANSAADTTLSRAKAIDAMMKAIDPNGNATVMWVNTFTTKTDGYWSNANMKTWNKELETARGRWPNMHIFDWASIAATGKAPFSDGIHHTTEGFKVRNAAIAKAVSEL